MARPPQLNPGRFTVPSAPHAPPIFSMSTDTLILTLVTACRLPYWGSGGRGGSGLLLFFLTILITRMWIQKKDAFVVCPAPLSRQWVGL